MNQPLASLAADVNSSLRWGRPECFKVSLSSQRRIVMSMRRSCACVVVLIAFHFSLDSFATAATKADPTGTWTWVRELEGQEAQSVLSLSYEDGKLSGSYKRQGQVVLIANGKFEKSEISFEADGKWNDQKVHGKFKGKLSADEINGTIEIAIEDGSLPLPWKAKRGVDADKLAGTWKLKFAAANGRTAESELKLSTEGGALKGTYQSARFGRHDAKEIKLNGLDLSWQVEFDRDGQSVKAIYKGKLSGRTLNGSLTLDAGSSSSTVEFKGEQISIQGVDGTGNSQANHAPKKQADKTTSERSNH
jgi:hypothetical protein